jgi:hypothetical protein
MVQLFIFLRRNISFAIVLDDLKEFASPDNVALTLSEYLPLDVMELFNDTLQKRIKNQ